MVNFIFDRRPVDTNLELKEHRMKAITVRGMRIIHASQVTNKEVKDDSTKLVIGADVEGLYHTLKDMEVANICYQAILKTTIKFSNIEFQKVSNYVAMNMTEDERTIHPLGSILRRRKSKTGSRPWVPGMMKNGENSWIVADKDGTDREKNVLVT